MAEARLTAVVSTKGAVKAEKELNKIAKTAKVVDINVKKTGKTFKTFGSNAARAVAAIDGPLGGISSRITAITSLANSGAIAFAGFAAAIVATSFAIVKGVSALDEYDVNLRRVNAAIKATGAGVGFTGEQLLKEAENLALATLTSVDAVQKAQAKLLTFNRVLGAEFTKTIKLSQDLAEAGFGSIESNAILLGKALQDPIKGMAALSRVGVTLSETQKQLAQDAVNAGDVFKAQGIILAAIAGQVDGVAESVANGTLSGAIDTLGHNWDELSRTVAKNSGALSTWTRIIKGAGIAAKLLSDALAPTDASELIATTAAAFDELTKSQQDLLQMTDRTTLSYRNQEALIKKNVATYKEALNLSIKAQDAEDVLAKKREDAAKREAETRIATNKAAKEESDLKLSKQKEIDDKRQATMEAAAKRELTTLLNLNNSELQAIDAKETARLERLNSSNILELEGLTLFNAAKKEIEEKAQADRQELYDKDIKANKDKNDKKTKQEQAAQAAKLGIISGAFSALAAASEKESGMFKAAAVASALVNTYAGAASAYTSALEIGPAGLALAPVAAATAVAAGIANVRAITSSREQGGNLSAGQSSTVAERGQLEILTPSSSSRIRTKQQMQQLMGEGGSSSPTINIVNIDQSSNGVSIETSTDDDGRIIQLIRDTTALDASNPNSELRKTFAATTTLEARR